MGIDFEKKLATKQVEITRKNQQEVQKRHFAELEQRMRSSELLPVTDAEFLTTDAREALLGYVKAHLIAGIRPEQFVRATSHPTNEKTRLDWLDNSVKGTFTSSVTKEMIAGWPIIYERYSSYGSNYFDDRYFILTPDNRIGAHCGKGTRVHIEIGLSDFSKNVAVEQVQSASGDPENLFTAPWGYSNVESKSSRIIDSVMTDMIAKNLPWPK